ARVDRRLGGELLAVGGQREPRVAVRRGAVEGEERAAARLAREAYLDRHAARLRPDHLHLVAALAQHLARGVELRLQRGDVVRTLRREVVALVRVAREVEELALAGVEALDQLEVAA